VLGFAHDWANREATLRSWELVARYVIPEINGYTQRLRDPQAYLDAHQPELIAGADAPFVHRCVAAATSRRREVFTRPSCRPRDARPMVRHLDRRLVGLGLVAALTLGACGGDDESGDTTSPTTEPPATTTAESTTSVPKASMSSTASATSPPTCSAARCSARESHSECPRSGPDPTMSSGPAPVVRTSDATSSGLPDVVPVSRP
jgi:hypothetical protein